MKNVKKSVLKAVFAQAIRNIAIIYVMVLLVVGAYELSPENYHEF